MKKIFLIILYFAIISHFIFGTIGCTQFDPLSLVYQKEETIHKKFSKALVKTQNAKIIFNNEESFRSKVKIIESAKKSLKMSYYIFSNDTSSAYFASKIIKAAKRGVKVEILLDLHTEYKNLAYFSMLMNQGEGNIDIRFYGRPNIELMKDVIYLTSGCSKDDSEKKHCDQIKNSKIEALFDAESDENKQVGISNLNTGFSGQFLAGLYAKDLSLISGSVLAGQNIDITQFKKIKTTPEELKRLKKLGVIAWKAYFGSTALKKFVNKIKLGIAFLVYKDHLNPIRSALKEYLPLNSANNKKRLKQWTHITDFMHHKFLMADGKKIQLGGRNIENSYHMKRNSQLKRYMFLDTDIYADLLEGNKDLEKTFDDLFHYKTLVAKLLEVKEFAPNESYLEKKHLSSYCGNRKKNKDFKSCVKKAPKFSITKHRKALYKQLIERTKKFEEYSPERSHPLVEQYIESAGDNGTLKISPQAKLYYLENVPYSLNKEGIPEKRIFGTDLNKDDFLSKGIHGVWAYHMLRSCITSKKEKRAINIYINTAYLFPSSEMLSVMGRMIDGTLDCQNVTVHFMTNSKKTTDLFFINYAADFVLKSFFSSPKNKYISRYGKGKSANFILYEYAELNSSAQTPPPSLHSKVLIFDKAIYVGSANFDTRSLVMDTNNGFLITEDPNLVKQYKTLMRSMVKAGVVVEVANFLKQDSLFYKKELNYFTAQAYGVVEFLLQKYQLSPERNKFIKKNFWSVTKLVHDKANLILFGALRRGDKRGSSKNEVTGVTSDRKAMKVFNLITKEL